MMQSAKIFMSFLIVTASGMQMPDARQKIQVAFSAEGKTSMVKDSRAEQDAHLGAGVKQEDDAVFMARIQDTLGEADLDKLIRTIKVGLLRTINGDEAVLMARIRSKPAVQSKTAGKAEETRLGKTRALYFKAHRLLQTMTQEIGTDVATDELAATAILGGGLSFLKQTADTQDLANAGPAKATNTSADQQVLVAMTTAGVQGGHAIQSSIASATASLNVDVGLLQTADFSQLAARLASDVAVLNDVLHTMAQTSSTVAATATSACDGQQSGNVCGAIASDNVFGDAASDFDSDAAEATLLLRHLRASSLLESESKNMRRQTHAEGDADKNQAMILESYLHKFMHIVEDAHQHEAALQGAMGTFFEALATDASEVADAPALATAADSAQAEANAPAASGP